MIRNFLKGIFVFASLICAFAANAAVSDNTPIEVALFPPLQLPSTGYGVKGIRLSVVGSNREARGLDLAVLGNLTEDMFKGIAIAGLFNYNHGSSVVTGLQIAGLANLNLGHSEVYGVQFAAYNYSGAVYGLQLGLVNVANDLHGVQIGLFNINHNGPFHASPIINASF